MDNLKFFSKQYTNDQIYEIMHNIVNCHTNANENHMKYHFTPDSMVIIKEEIYEITTVIKDVDNKETSELWWQCKLVLPLWITV